MNLRKAAEMALEIIEGEWPADDEIASPVMYALREALAKPEQDPVAWMMFGVDKPTRVILHKPSDEHKKVFSCIFPLYTHEEALAQPEQEPYAYTAEGECWSCRFTSKVDTEFRLKALNIPLEKLRYLYPHPAPIPEGWQLVPVEPTARMRNAFFQAYFPGPDIEVKIYKAMLAAAPKPEE